MIFMVVIFAYGISITPEPVEISGEHKAYTFPVINPFKEPLKIKEREYTYSPAQDSIWIDVLLPPDSFLVIKFSNGKFYDSLSPSYYLSYEAKEIIDKCPSWLKNDLIENLIHMNWDVQDKCARIIKNNTDPRILDELYFQIAHLAPQVLLRMNENIPAENAKYLYIIDEDLSYVDIVDYGDPETDTNYYSTTKYCVISNGNKMWVEIPKEIYYWWVVMPKGTDELPRNDASVYNKFWREYLYYSDEGHDYTAGGSYPLLKDVLANVEVYWDGKKHVWPGGREYSDTMSLVNALGWWASEVVPNPATGNRPIQPNVIAYEHNGNCGELQDLLWAAGRTALIPILGTMLISEDHVWNAVYWPLDSTWHEYQVDLGHGSTHVADSGTSYDSPRRQNSCLWNWRGDGYQWSFIEYYSPYCSLTVCVFDKNGVPYPEHNIKISSDAIWGGIAKGFAGITDRNGMYTTTLGDLQNYYVEGLGKVIDSADAQPGTHFWVYDTLSSELKIKTPKGKQKEGTWKGYTLSAEINIPYEIGHGYSFSYEEVLQYYMKKFTPGILDYFYIMDREALPKFIAGYGFEYFYNDTGFTSLEKDYEVPSSEDMFIVFYNSNPKLSVVVQGWLKSYPSQGGIAQKNKRNKKELLTPFYSRENKIFLPKKQTVEIYDVGGRKIKLIQNTTEIDTKELPPGIYFVKFKEQKKIKKFIVMK